jgi:predicted DNA-binding protein with PD1-like motif
MQQRQIHAAGRQRTFVVVLETGEQVMDNLKRFIAAEHIGAGHLAEAHVRPTLEVILAKSPAHLRKVKDKDSGLPLIRPAA